MSALRRTQDVSSVASGLLLGPLASEGAFEAAPGGFGVKPQGLRALNENSTV